MKNKWIHYNDFANTIKTAEHLYSLDNKLNHDPPRGKSEITSTEALRGSASVICVACFESYLRKLFEGYISELVNKVQFVLLPEKIRLSNIYNTMDYCLKPPKSSSLHAERALRINDVMVIMTNIGTGLIEPAVFSNTSSNPSPEQVSKMFGDIGIKDIFKKIKTYFEKHWKAPVSDNFIRDKLDEVVKRRHNVAHTASALNISREQIKESFRFLKVLSRCLEHTIYIHIKDMIKTCKI